MRCTNCGTELIPGKRFCHACGTEAAQACPSCGRPVEAGFRFCPDCGARIAPDTPTAAAPTPAPAVNDRLARLSKHIPQSLAEKIRASTGAIAGERKLVTVLFCDLVGSTAIAERLDPEDYRDLLEQYLELAFAEIYRLEGIVNQLAGDGFMALFGAPVAHEGAPERALRAALAIRDALGRFNEQARATRGIELQARIGIHTGPVVVGTVGNDLKMDYSAIGDTTNLASRLQSLAAAGMILISQSTHRLVRGIFDVRPAGPFTVKGKSEPVAAYEVLGLSEAATPMSIAVERGLTPLVGRRGELAQLHACFERLGGNLAQLVSVIGAAGSGKSRLLYEFKQQLGNEDVVFFEARCSALSQVVPYDPWVNMLRQYFELASGESPGCACEKIAGKVRPWDERLDQFYPYLCRLLSVPVDGVADMPVEELKRATFHAVAHVVVGASKQAPVVMFLEDVQWIDESSREMLEMAVGGMRADRIMLVLSHRPDDPLTWRTHAAHTQLQLRPLSDEETTVIIRALAGGPLPAELEQRILHKAEGNPFVTEEITRSLVEEGYLLRNNGTIRLTRPAAEIRMPDTVQELIGVRLDRLQPSTKRVAQVAAVLGRQFCRHQLAQLFTGDGIDVEHELDELERRGVIHRKNVLSKDEYRFGESLTQEVAYEALLLKERRQLHERIALMLEAGTDATSPERAALLAHHFARSDNRPKAIEALLRAAHHAEQLPSYPAALAAYRQAWELADGALTAAAPVDEHMRRLGVQVALGLCKIVVLYDSPDRGDTERAALRGRALAEGLGDATSVASFLAYHGMMMGHERARFAEGLALIEQGLAVAQRAGLELPAISISRALAWTYILDGRAAQARATFDWVVSELERREAGPRPSDLYLSARWMRDSVHYFSDDLDGALESLTRTYELAVQAPNRTIQSTSAATCAMVHFVRADYAEAKRWADRSLEIAQVIGNIGTLRSATLLAFATRVELGEPVGATNDIELIEHGLTTGGNMLLYIGLIVETFLALGELKQAEQFARLAHEHAAGRLRELLSAAALGNVMLRLGPSRWTEAQQWFEQAISLAETLGARSTLAIARLGAGELAAERGNREAATRQLRQALAICRELRLGRYQQRVEQLLAALDAPAELPAAAS